MMNDVMISTFLSLLLFEQTLCRILVYVVGCFSLLFLAEGDVLFGLYLPSRVVVFVKQFLHPNVENGAGVAQGAAPELARDTASVLWYLCSLLCGCIVIKWTVIKATESRGVWYVP
jgi:hypothetical protein